MLTEIYIEALSVDEELADPETAGISTFNADTAGILLASRVFPAI